MMKAISSFFGMSKVNIDARNNKEEEQNKKFLGEPIFSDSDELVDLSLQNKMVEYQSQPQSQAQPGSESQLSKIGSAIGGALLQHVGVPLIKNVGVPLLQVYTQQRFGENSTFKVQNNQKIAEAKKTMALLKDPQFIQFYELLNGLILKEVDNQIIKFEGDPLQKKTLVDSSEPIKNLIEVNLALGFANLADKVHQQRETIPNYSKQTTLENIFSVLFLNSDQVISRAKLAEIDNDEELSPAERDEKLNTIFEAISEQILTSLFPNKLTDLALTNEVQLILSLLGGAKFDIYKNYVRTPLRDFLKNLYESVKVNPNHQSQWEEDLQTRLKVPNLLMLTKLPTTFSVEYLKHLIQSDPKVVDFLTAYLTSILHKKTMKEEISLPRLKEILKDDLTEEQCDIFNPGQLEALAKMSADFRKSLLRKSSSEIQEAIKQSQAIEEGQTTALPLMKCRELANWMIHSLQGVLHTENPQFIGIGKFVEEVIHHFTLGVLVKGAHLFIPDGSDTSNGQFIKVLSTELLGKKYTDLTNGEVISKQLWSDFIADLPLPGLMRSFVVDQLVEKSNEAAVKLRDAIDFKNFTDAGIAAAAQIEASSNGKQIEEGIDIITQKLKEWLLNESPEKLASLGEDAVNDLFVKYLPGIKIDSSLRDWVIQNIRVLGVSSITPRIVELLEDGIRITLNITLANSLKGNFDRSGQYISQFFKFVQTAFASSFSLEDPSQMKNVEVALAIQEEIQNTSESIKNVRSQLQNKPTGLNSDQLKCIEQIAEAETRVYEAERSLRDLEAKRDALLESINHDYENEAEGWNEQSLSALSSILDLQKQESQNYSSVQEHIQAIRNELQELEEKSKDVAVEGVDREKQTKRHEQLNRLLAILEMSANSLKMLLEAQNLEITRLNGQTELKHLTEDRNKKIQGLQVLDQLDVDNLEAWGAAKVWVLEIPACLLKIDELSRELLTIQDATPALGCFRSLTNLAFALMGLNDKDVFKLPSWLSERLWPILEQAKAEKIPTILLPQVAPVLLTLQNVAQQRASLRSYNGGNEFLIQIASLASQKIVEQIPSLMSQKELIDPQLSLILGENLQPILAPHLQTLLSEGDIFLQQNRTIIQQYVEGLILNTIVKIAQGDQSKNGRLKTIFNKLSAIYTKSSTKKRTSKVVARSMVNEILIQIFNINSEKDLDGIPAQLKKVVYDQVKDQASKQLEPLIKPILNLPKRRQSLRKKSGSEFLGNLCRALTKDISKAAPGLIKSHLSQVPLPEDIRTNLQQCVEKEENVIAEGLELPSLYIESVLINILNRVAAKHPANGKKDTVVLLTEKILKLVAEKYESTKKNFKRKAEESVQQAKVRHMKRIAKELSGSVLKDILGIDSPEAFSDLPPSLRPVIYDAIKNKVEDLEDLLVRSYRGLELLKDDDSKIKKVKKASRAFGVNKKTGVGHLETLSTDVAELLFHNITHSVLKTVGGKIEGVNTMSKNVGEVIKNMSNGTMVKGVPLQQVADTVAQYSEAGQLEKMAENSIKKLADPKQFVSDKRKAVEVTGNLILGVLNKASKKVAKFEKAHKKEFDQKLIKKLLEVTHEHLKNLDRAKGIAKKAGRSDIKHEDFVKAVGKKLHPAVPKKLTDQKNKVNAKQRSEKAYLPAAKVVVDMLFPNGKDDLTFVAEEFRENLWKQVNSDLFPILISSLVESLTNPDTINQIILSSLESAKETFSEPVKAESEKPKQKQPLDGLDKIGGECAEQVLKMVDLPKWMRKMIVGKDGKISDSMKKSIGASLRKQFDGKFIQTKLEAALKSAVSRDKKGNYMLKPEEAKSDDEKTKLRIKKQVQVKKQIESLSKENVKLGIIYFIRSTWVNAQASFDRAVDRVFGKVGLKAKRALDALFNFVFFKVIGSILSLLLSPFKGLVMKGIYRLIKLDKNREAIVSLLSKRPSDQSKENAHIVYHEDLLFKLGEALKATVDETVERRAKL